MKETLIVLGLFVLAFALRSARSVVARKTGAVMFLAASFWLGYFLTGSKLGGVLGVLFWFFLPWIELLTHIRRLRLPINNRLNHRRTPDPGLFPNAPEAAAAMEEAGFEHVSDCGWKWAGMQQFFRFYWHPEERAVSAICLCEQSDVAFAFISVTSYDLSGGTWRSTNFPFSPTLQNSPDIHWNPVPCERGCFHYILRQHREFLERRRVTADQLRIPDPEDVEDSLEREMRRQVEYNLAAGIIRLTGDGHFRYSKRGLLFLWGQFVKDMVRLC
ncbi:MAG: hypothetical protein J0M04_04545 [Verrucomicrobia bacterium]|nr:hypothetical protein [Verrucomicrobiota bacterium]